MDSFFNVDGVTREKAECAVNLICEKPPMPCMVDQYVVETFQAGQDFILSGDSDLALMLFRRLEHELITCVQLTPKELKGIKKFLDSDGTINPFGNFLLD